MKAFYPLCSPILDRRRFLKLSLMGAVAPVLLPDLIQAAPDPALAFIRRHAAVPDDPWRLAHGVRAVGAAFTLPDGRKAVDHLLSGFVRGVEVGGKRYLHFPRTVEVHTDMFVKTMLEAGVERHHPFQLEGQDHTLADLLESSKALFRFDPKTFDWNNLAWSLIAFSVVQADTWRNAFGEEIVLKDVAAFGLTTLRDATAPIQPFFAASQPLPKKAPIHGFTCGGTHLIYSLLVAARHGYLGPDGRERLQEPLRMLIYRMWADPDLIDRHYETLVSRTGVEEFQDDATLKILGHAVECLGYAVRHGLYQPRGAERDRIAKTKGEVKRLIASFGRIDLQPVRRRNFSLYQQIVGDTCHAHRGLGLWA